jgi:hypothetical protein
MSKLTVPKFCSAGGKMDAITVIVPADDEVKRQITQFLCANKVVHIQLFSVLCSSHGGDVEEENENVQKGRETNPNTPQRDRHH